MDEPVVKALSDTFVQTLSTNPVSRSLNPDTCISYKPHHIKLKFLSPAR